LALGIIALPVVASLLYLLTLRDSRMNGVVGWLGLVAVCGAAWLGAFSMVAEL
jgi:hypothetical protein